MRQTELILFIVVMLINGGIALYKKHKEREAARQAKSLEALSAAAREEARRLPRARTPAPAPKRTPAPTPRPVPAPTPVQDRTPAPAAKVPEPQSAPVVVRVAPIVAPAVAAARAPAAATRVPALAGRAALGTAGFALARRSMRGRAALRQAVLAAEVLGRPRSERPFGA